MPTSALSLFSVAAQRGADAFVGLDCVPEDLLSAFAGDHSSALPPRGAAPARVCAERCAVCAVLAGARSCVATPEWVHDLRGHVLEWLLTERVAPSESTVRRSLQAFDRNRVIASRRIGWRRAVASSTGRRSRWMSRACTARADPGGGLAHLLGTLAHR